MINLLSRVPQRTQPAVVPMVRAVCQQLSPQDVRAQHECVAVQLIDSFPSAAELLEEAREDILAFTSFPRCHWKQIWANNPLERLNREIRRRTDVLGIFPNGYHQAGWGSVRGATQ